MDSCPNAVSGKADLRTELVTGAEARELLRSSTHRMQVRTLHRRCAWSTALQSLEFVEAWYDCYKDVVVPFLVFASSDTGDLIGWLPLAAAEYSDRKELVVAGGHQCEYQAWLAANGRSDSFIVDALRKIKRETNYRKLSFVYMLDDVPRGWARRHIPGIRCIEYEHRRPVMDIATYSQQALKKKSNKSRLNRLRRLGEVRVQRVESRDRFLEIFPFITATYDLRQAAANGVRPFRNDCRKAGFYRRLAESDDLIRTYLLMVGEKVAAGIIGVPVRNSLSVGVYAYSPFLAEYSPGKFLLLLLAKELESSELDVIDLTPGGEWKQRFASRSESVWELGIYFSQVRYLRDRLIALLLDTARSMLKVMGLSPAQLRIHLKAVFGIRSNRRGGQSKGVHESEDGQVLYVVDAQDLSGRRVQVHPSRDDIEELLQYNRDARDQYDFYSMCLARIQKGYSFLTHVEAGKLLGCCWLSHSEHDKHYSELARRTGLGQKVVFLSGIYMSSSADSMSSVDRILGGFLSEALATGADQLCVDLSASEKVFAEILLALGFRPVRRSPSI